MSTSERRIAGTLMILGLLTLTSCGNSEGASTQPSQTQGETGGARTPTPTPNNSQGVDSVAPSKLMKLSGARIPTVSTTRPPAVAWDNPSSDYQSLAAVKTAGPAAVGKTLSIKAYTIRLAPPTGEILTELYECQPAEGDEMAIDVSYDAKLRDVLRAIPTGSSCENSCPRVLIKISGFDSWQTPQGELIQVYDIQPDPPPAKLPDGVNYAAMDDALLDGPAAVGKVLDLGVYMGAMTEEDAGKRWDLHSQVCGDHSGYNATLHLYENAENLPFIKGLPFDAGSTCQRIRVKLLKGPSYAFSKSYVVQLLGVGEQYKRLSPEPCP